MEYVWTTQRVYVTTDLVVIRARFLFALKAVLAKDNVSVRTSASVIVVGLVPAVRNLPVKITITVRVMSPKHMLVEVIVF